MGRFGKLWFKNQQGLLIFTVPLQARSWVLQRFAGAIVRGSVQGPSLDGSAFVAHFALQTRLGMKASFPRGAGGGERLDLLALQVAYSAKPFVQGPHSDCVAPIQEDVCHRIPLCHGAVRCHLSAFENVTLRSIGA